LGPSSTHAVANKDELIQAQVGCKIEHVLGEALRGEAFAGMVGSTVSAQVDHDQAQIFGVVVTEQGIPERPGTIAPPTVHEE
jgi:hypothetical protein